MKYVFFIDDDELLRDVFPRAFHSWRRSWADGAVELRVADSTAQLLDMLDLVTNVDEVLLITDGNMRGAPGFDLDGDELIKAVRRLIGARLVCAAIMTGNPDFFYHASQELGAELIDKPVQTETLKRMILKFVKR
jgi:DNA-binding NtrC family response regulator